MSGGGKTYRHQLCLMNQVSTATILYFCQFWLFSSQLIWSYVRREQIIKKTVHGFFEPLRIFLLKVWLYKYHMHPIVIAHAEYIIRSSFTHQTSALCDTDLLSRFFRSQWLFNMLSKAAVGAARQSPVPHFTVHSNKVKLTDD